MEEELGLSISTSFLVPISPDCGELINTTRLQFGAWAQ